MATGTRAKKTPAAKVEPTDSGKPDTDDADAAVAEAEDKPVEVQFAGNKYLIRADLWNDLDYREAAQDGKDMVMMRVALGPEQWRLFKSRHTLEDFNSFMDDFGTRSGSGNR